MTVIPLIDNSYDYLAYSTPNIWDAPLLKYVAEILNLNLRTITTECGREFHELHIPDEIADNAINTILDSGRTIVILQYDVNNRTFEVDEVIEPSEYESDDDTMFSKLKNWFRFIYS